MKKERHLIENPADAIRYILGGQGKSTLVGRSSRYTYKFGHPDNSQFPIFVGLLTGADNESDYHYIGCIRNMLDGTAGADSYPYISIMAGRKGNSSHPAFKAMAWYLSMAQNSPEIAVKAQFWHEGVCCRCGRTLTVPSSIESGIGPICASKG